MQVLCVFDKESATKSLLIVATQASHHIKLHVCLLNGQWLGCPISVSFCHKKLECEKQCHLCRSKHAKRQAMQASPPGYNDICFCQIHVSSRFVTKTSKPDNISPRLQLVSSVLFLTESGGPTLVLDQDPQGPLASRGWLVQPCPNQLLAFKGNLLHGVIPGKRCLIPAICMILVPSTNGVLVQSHLWTALCSLTLVGSFLPCIHVSLECRVIIQAQYMPTPTVSFEIWGCV